MSRGLMSLRAERSGEDLRLVASRERLLAIPIWRLVKLWRAGIEHVRLLGEIEQERRS